VVSVPLANFLAARQQCQIPDTRTIKKEPGAATITKFYIFTSDYGFKKMKLKLLKKDLYLDQTLIVTLSGRSYSHKHMPISLLILRPESQILELII